MLVSEARTYDFHIEPPYSSSIENALDGLSLFGRGRLLTCQNIGPRVGLGVGSENLEGWVKKLRSQRGVESGFTGASKPSGCYMAKESSSGRNCRIAGTLEGTSGKETVSTAPVSLSEFEVVVGVLWRGQRPECGSSYPACRISGSCTTSPCLRKLSAFRLSADW